MTTKNKSFQQMKKDSQSGKTFKRVYGQMSQRKGTWAKTRIRRALVGLGNTKLANSILNCRKGQLCGQVYCSSCRDKAAQSLKDRISKRIQQRFRNDPDKSREQLRHTTVLCGLVDFNLSSVKQSVSQARKDINAFKRRFKDVWFQGAFEFELIDLDKLLVWDGDNQVKKETLEKMTDKRGNLILVHFHGLMDLNGVDEKLVKEWVGQRWNKHHRQTHLQRIRKGQRLGEMTWKVSSYCFKNRVKDNMTFIARGFEEGEYFTNEELSNLIKIYDGVGGGKGVSGLLIGIGK
jgi:hypothetical protein